ncbi:class I SAM-dependent methyltransferase [Neolewinella antarctica]|uniref:SAM-dependent methyltransferase n=1 Tax=Neolewinella antarctica TaxID=442734 RepID=A0ABX0XAI0_9BACT|nr:class I SAM-dependent methyltransferase [Neolewinella antarctica]NJC25833.1 SAM-dependent methyltransferase [Neolewinella antarctica]
MADYHPEPYWTKVADRIDGRGGRNVIAGDDEPYYRYKRHRFLEMLSNVDFAGKSVLEIGHGPGGNLKYIYDNFKPKEIQGVDISTSMVELAGKHLPEEIKLTKIDGTSLPFADKSFDIVFTATVLQHNTDEQMLATIIAEICRVANGEVHIFERIDDPIAGDELCMGRPVGYYEDLFRKGGFGLKETEFINIHSSYLVAGATRKLLNPKVREEGEPLTKLSLGIQAALMPLTKQLDSVLTTKRDLARLSFTRNK